MYAMTLARSTPIYKYLETESDYYRNHCADPKLRSRINVVFRIGNKNTALETKFAMEAEQAGLLGLKGHAWVGGVRITMNNSMPFEGVFKLLDFMRAFKLQNPL